MLIEPDGVQLVFPEGALRAISDYLAGLFDDVWNGTRETEDVEHAAIELSVVMPCLTSSISFLGTSAGQFHRPNETQSDDLTSTGVGKQVGGSRLIDWAT